MLEKEMLDKDLERAFADMATSLELEAPDSVAPWGFVAVAAFTPGPGAEASTDAALEAQDIEAIWKLVETFHNFAANVEIKETPDAELMAKLTKDVQSVTTDPFYCVVPGSTYPITHAGVQQEITNAFQSLFNANLYSPRSKVQVIQRDSPWLVSPTIAVVTYRTQAVDDPNEQLESKSFAVLFKQYGNWKLNILTSDVFHASGEDHKMSSSAK